jgi:hypothetical protein
MYFFNYTKQKKLFETFESSSLSKTMNERLYQKTKNNFNFNIFNKFIHMENSIKKLKKGFLTLFLLNILIIFTSIFIQSCQTESINDNNSITELKRDVTKFQKDFASFNERLKTSKVENDSIKNAEALKMLMPIVKSTKEVLRNNFEIEEYELKEIFEGNSDDPRIALVGLAIITKEKAGEVELADKFMNSIGTSAYAFPTGNQAIDCALEALGFSSTDLIKDFITGNLTKGAVKRLVIGMASRALGPIGVAFIVAEWGICMSS